MDKLEHIPKTEESKESTREKWIERLRKVNPFLVVRAIKRTGDSDATAIDMFPAEETRNEHKRTGLNFVPQRALLTPAEMDVCKEAVDSGLIDIIYLPGGTWIGTTHP